jgi:DDE superfamily endonuclease
MQLNCHVNHRKTVRSSQGATDRVQLLRCEYWDKVRELEPKNMVFLDETGILLGCVRHHARSEKGTRVYDLKPFYRGKKVTVIGAITMDKVLAVMTMDNSMDGNAFHVFIEKFLGIPESSSIIQPLRKIALLFCHSIGKSRVYRCPNSSCRWSRASWVRITVVSSKIYRNFDIRSTASCNLAGSCTKANRTYPSPHFPKPTPGEAATPV